MDKVVIKIIIGTSSPFVDNQGNRLFLMGPRTLAALARLLETFIISGATSGQVAPQPSTRAQIDAAKKAVPNRTEAFVSGAGHIASSFS